MDHKLARGHANAYLSKLPDHAGLLRWVEGPKRDQCMLSFKESGRSKKPGRTLKRLVPLLRPAFVRPSLGYWERSQKSVMAEAITTAPEVDVFDIASADTPLYQEKAAFLSNLFIKQRGDEVVSFMITVANISRHTLARMLERELATAETLSKEAREVLKIVRTVALARQKTSLDPDGTYSFLLPYRGGAFPGRYHERASTRSRPESTGPGCATQGLLYPNLSRARDADSRRSGADQRLRPFDGRHHRARVGRRDHPLDRTKRPSIYAPGSSGGRSRNTEMEPVIRAWRRRSGRGSERWRWR